MTNHILSAVIVIVLIGVAAAGAVWGWRRRRARQADVPELPAVPGLAATAGHRGKYVATTSAGDPYDRITVRGLAFRGFATVSVHPEGLLVERDGETSIWIPKDRLVGAGRATWTIDRVVEENGLHLIRWRLGERELDTYLRIDEPLAFDDDLAALHPKEVSA